MLLEKIKFFKLFKNVISIEELQSIWIKYLEAMKELKYERYLIKSQYEKKIQLKEELNKEKFNIFYQDLKRRNKKEYAIIEKELSDYYKGIIEMPKIMDNIDLYEELRDIEESIKFKILKSEVYDIENSYVKLLKKSKIKLAMNQSEKNSEWQYVIKVGKQYRSIRKSKDILCMNSGTIVIAEISDIKYFELVKYLLKKYIIFAEQDKYSRGKNNFYEINRVKKFISKILN